MSWEISHTDEAWFNVRRNLELWDRGELIEALADDAFEAQEQAWNESDAAAPYHHGAEAAEELRSLLRDAPHDGLVEMVMRTIADHGRCSNGGYDFWIDRQGYHTVPVDFAPEDPELKFYNF